MNEKTFNILQGISMIVFVIFIFLFLILSIFFQNEYIIKCEFLNNQERTITRSYIFEPSKSSLISECAGPRNQVISAKVIS